MVLTADAGNTNIKLGIIHQEKLLTKKRISTGAANISSDYDKDILEILRENSIDIKSIEGSCVSTVVPDATKEFVACLHRLFSQEPLVVNYSTKSGIEIKTDNPAELGIDRLVNVSAALHYYGGSLLVIDFGTATTYDVVTADGAFLGGIIAPGIKICSDALWEKTEKLPRIPIKKPDKVMGTNTVASMQSGVFFGYLGQVEYLIRRLKEERKTHLKVIATGGLAEIITAHTELIDVYDEDLTLKGLNYIYRLN